MMKIDKRTSQQIEHMYNADHDIKFIQGTILKMLEVLSIPFKLKYDELQNRQLMSIVLDSNDETELKLNRSDQADQLRKVIQEIQANDYKKYNRNN